MACWNSARHSARDERKARERAVWAANAVRRICIMILSPVDDTAPHLKFMAAISKLLIDTDTRERLLNAKTPADMLAVLAG
jgi:mannitol/fructose-specific phosphotransferase system IIA component (Ntr-type)